VTRGAAQGARAIGLAVALAAGACSTAAPARPPVAAARVAAEPARPPADDGPAAPAAERGQATWYGGKHHRRPTASGERFDKRAMTAAHRTLPFGSIVRVTNLDNGRTVEVRINDRGPFGKGRIIDVSEAAARVLGMIDAGVVPALVEVLYLAPAKRRGRR
jgi:rare lipoprotein A